MTITDEHNRSFKNLRLSLLNACNFACVYCTDDAPVKTIQQNTLNTHQLINLVSKLHQTLKLDSIRLTGGEPLLYPNLDALIKGLTEIGIPNIKMTTNAFLLSQNAEKLKHAGLKEINVSLDAVDHATFFRITKRDKLKEVIKGIDDAVNCGLNVKLNSVIMNNINHQQIIPLLKFAEERMFSIRFLEVMAMGHLYQNNHQLFSQQQILDEISQYYQFKSLKREISATANYWQTNTGVKFGVIANTSAPFCSDCNRLRLDNYGNIFGCLSNNQPISIVQADTSAKLNQCLNDALLQKQSLKFTGSKLSMLQIGG